MGMSQAGAKAEARAHRQHVASSVSSLALPSRGPGGSVSSSELSSLLLCISSHGIGVHLQGKPQWLKEV